MNPREFAKKLSRGETIEVEEEIVLDRRTGEPRQAGTVDPSNNFVLRYRQLAERSLFFFGKAILKSDRFSKDLHRPVCDFLTTTPPYRKLVLLPRDHLKSRIVAQCMPIHILLQPKEHNIYFPGRDGADMRILLSNETATNAEHFLRWIMANFESQKMLRAFWPHRCWANSRRDSKKWNEKEMLIPRTEIYPEASIETIGVGGAITSRHYNALIKDDLISIEAANSPLVMYTAIEWHKASRALMDDPDKSLEFIVGTRWAVHDLYQHIEDNDPSVEIYRRAAVEDGKPIFPLMFSMATLERKRKEFGVLYPLLYLNSATDPELTDFDLEDLREFHISGTDIIFDEDERDVVLVEEHKAPAPQPGIPPGTPLRIEDIGKLYGKGEFLRFRYG